MKRRKSSASATSAARFIAVFLVVAGCLANSGCSSTPAAFYGVALTPGSPQTIGESQSVNITGSVMNDTSGQGVTWSLRPSGAPGALSNATTTSVTYTAPASVAAATTVTVVATSIAHKSGSGSLSITIEPKPSITTTTLPAGKVGVVYSATARATGGVGPFSWSVASGSLPGGLALAASTTNSVTISGTPTAQGASNFTLQVSDSTGASSTQALSITIGAPLGLAVTTTSLPNGGVGVAYTQQLQASGGLAPYTWTLTSAPSTLPPGLTLAANGTVSGTPGMVGIHTFTVQVADAENPAATASGTVAISIGDFSQIASAFAFDFLGVDSSGGAVVAAGSFTVDSSGSITAGVADYNTSSGPAHYTLTGSATIGADGRGTLSFTIPGSPVYAFAATGGALNARLIEIDSSGTRGSGQLVKQTTLTCDPTAINGYFVFGLTGGVETSASTTPGPVALAGAFQATAGTGSTPGSISNGEMDANTPNSPFAFPPSPQTLSGTYTASANPAACSISLSPSNLPSGSTITFDAYPAAPRQFFLVETDSSVAAPYLLAGRLDVQSGPPFTGPSAFSGTNVGAISGQVLSGSKYVPDVAIAWLSSSGGGSYQMSAWENSGGSPVTYGVTGGVPSPFSESYTVDQYGRVTSSLRSPFAPIFYVIDSVDSVMIGTAQNNPMIGYFQPQLGSLIAGSIAGTFAEGTAPSLVGAAPTDVGSISLDGTSGVTGTQDQAAATGNASAQAVSGSYLGVNSTYGNGSYTLTSPSAFGGVFLIVSQNEVVVISTGSSDTNPVLLFLEK